MSDQLTQRIAEAIRTELDGILDHVGIERSLPDDLARAVVEAIHNEASWDLLMSILDRHYPEDIFPTMVDRKDRDPGPRIISLIRHLDAAPPRQFIDDLGRRWEWCGGVPETWAWRITENAQSPPSSDTRLALEQELLEALAKIRAWAK